MRRNDARPTCDHFLSASDSLPIRPRQAGRPSKYSCVQCRANARSRQNRESARKWRAKHPWATKVRKLVDRVVGEVIDVTLSTRRDVSASDARRLRRELTPWLRRWLALTRSEAALLQLIPPAEWAPKPVTLWVPCVLHPGNDLWRPDGHRPRVTWGTVGGVLLAVTLTGRTQCSRCGGSVDGEDGTALEAVVLNPRSVQKCSAERDWERLETFSAYERPL
jgi:hypothetical protein